MDQARIERGAMALAHSNWETCMRHARNSGRAWTITFENFWRKNAAISRDWARTVLEATDRKDS